MHNSSVETAMRLEFTVNLKPVKHPRPPKAKAIQKEPRLRQSLIFAHDLQRLFKIGKASSFSQVTTWLHMTHARLSQLLSLLLLAPDIQEAILCDETGKVSGLTERHIRQIAMEVDWQKQWELWQQVLAAQTPPPPPECPSPEILRPT